MRFVFRATLALLTSCAPAHAASGVGAPQRPPITGIAHVALATGNMEAERAFFTHTLGWNAVASPEFAEGMRFYGQPLQTVEVRPVRAGGAPGLLHVAWATPNAEGMRVYLKSKGVSVPAELTALGDGAQLFAVRDPEGNTVEFVQRVPGGEEPKVPDSAETKAARGIEPATPDATQATAPESLAGRIIHAGFIVRSAAAEDRFYRDVLGFHPYWHGGMKDGTTDWISLQVPEGSDWVEYMLNIPPNPSRRQLGMQDHLSLGMVSMEPVIAKLKGRGWSPSPASHEQMGRNGREQLNLFDPDETRVELMEFKARQTPCCSPVTGREPGVNQ